jgi:hypothetical protein
MTRLAPALSSFDSDSSKLARAAMNRSGRRLRAVSTMKTFSASELAATISARARSMPASLSRASLAALPASASTPSASSRSTFSGFKSMTTKGRPSARKVWAMKRPTRP